MDPFRKVNSGDPLSGSISSELYNLVIDMVQRYVREGRGDFHPGESKAPGNLELQIQNATPSPGTSLAQYAVVGIGAPLVVPAEADASFFGATIFASTAPQAGKPFAILQKPAVCGTFDGFGNPQQPGDIQPALVAGMTYAMVDIGHVGDGYADATNENYTNLTSGATGQAQILWTETEEAGIQWALIRLPSGSPQTCLAITTSPITARSGAQFGQGTAELQSLPGGALTDAEAAAEIYNKFAHVIPTGVTVSLLRDGTTGELWVVEPDVQRRTRCPNSTHVLVAEWSLDGGTTWSGDPTTAIGCVPCGCGSGSGSGSGPCQTCVTITGDISGSGGCNGSYCATSAGTNSWQILGVRDCLIGFSCFATSSGCGCPTTSYSAMNVAFPGVASANCNCAPLAAGVTMTWLTGGCGVWQTSNIAASCGGGCTSYYNALFQVDCTPGGQFIYLYVKYFCGAPDDYEASYTPAAGQVPWDGTTPLVMNLVGVSSTFFGPNMCVPASWPATVTVYPAGTINGGAGCTCTLTVNGVSYTTTTATCSPVGATFPGVSLGACGCGGSVTVSVGSCGSGSGSGSGSGGSGGCSQTVTLLASGNATGDSLTIPVPGTVPAHSLITVRIGYVVLGGNSNASFSMTFPGAASGNTSSSLTNYVIGTDTYSLVVAEIGAAVGAGAVTGGSAVISVGGPSGLILAVVTGVTGVAGNPDYPARKGSGEAGSQPDTGFGFHPTANACEYSDAVILVASAAGETLGSWQNSYADSGTGLLVSGTVAGTVFNLLCGDRTDIPVSTSLDAAMTGLSPTPLAWAALQAPYS